MRQPDSDSAAGLTGAIWHTLQAVSSPVYDPIRESARFKAL